MCVCNKKVVFLWVALQMLTNIIPLYFYFIYIISVTPEMIIFLSSVTWLVGKYSLVSANWSVFIFIISTRFLFYFPFDLSFVFSFILYSLSLSVPLCILLLFLFVCCPFLYHFTFSSSLYSIYFSLCILFSLYSAFLSLCISFFFVL